MKDVWTQVECMIRVQLWLSHFNFFTGFVQWPLKYSLGEFATSSSELLVLFKSDC